MASSSRRFLHGTSPRLLKFAAVMLLIVVIVSALLSFTGQSELAARGGIPAMVAWGWPVVVDGTIIMGTVAVLILRTRGVALYAWIVLIVFGTISTLANGMHATGAHLGEPVKFLIGAVPAISLLLSTHLLVLMVSAPDDVPTETTPTTDRDLARVPVPNASRPQVSAPQEPQAPVRQPALTPALQTPAPKPATPRPSVVDAGPAAEHSKDETEAWIINQLRHTGQVPSGQAVADHLGRSRSVGSRFRTDLAHRNPEVAQALGIPVRPRLVEAHA